MTVLWLAFVVLVRNGNGVGWAQVCGVLSHPVPCLGGKNQGGGYESDSTNERNDITCKGTKIDE